MLITNLTDAPGKNATELEIYNKTLSPGAQLKLPADLINKRIRALEDKGLLSIGSLPPWYVAAKQRKGRPLSEEEIKRRQTVKPVIAVKGLTSVKEDFTKISEAAERAEVEVRKTKG